MLDELKVIVKEHKKLLEAQSRLENKLSRIRPGHYLVDGEVWEVELQWDGAHSLVLNHKVIQE